MARNHFWFRCSVFSHTAITIDRPVPICGWKHDGTVIAKCQTRPPATAGTRKMMRAGQEIGLAYPQNFFEHQTYDGARCVVSMNHGENGFKSGRDRSRA